MLFALAIFRRISVRFCLIQVKLYSRMMHYRLGSIDLMVDFYNLLKTAPIDVIVNAVINSLVQIQRKNKMMFLIINIQPKIVCCKCSSSVYNQYRLSCIRYDVVLDEMSNIPSRLI